MEQEKEIVFKGLLCCIYLNANCQSCPFNEIRNQSNCRAILSKAVSEWIEYGFIGTGPLEKILRK